MTNNNTYVLHYIEEAIENFYSPEMKCYEGLRDLFDMLKEAEDADEYFNILVDIDNLLCDIEYKEVEEIMKEDYDVLKELSKDAKDQDVFPDALEYVTEKHADVIEELAKDD